MAGKHSRVRMFSSPAGIAATAAVATVLAVGGTVGVTRLTGSADPAASTPTGAPTAPFVAAPSPTGTASASPQATVTPSASPTATRSPQAASRGSARKPAPRPTATTKKSPAPKKAAPKPAVTVVESGTCGASFYAEGQLTANGENFDPEALTAAHKTLPFDTRVRVTNPANGKSVVVRINDRGPFIAGRCIDLSRAAFRAVASLDLGHVTVRYEVLG